MEYGRPDDDRNIVVRLMRHWQDERHAPDILPFQGEVVETALQQLNEQGELLVRLQTRDDTSEEEHFKMMLVRTEMERVKFVIRSYLRTRLYKIERFAPYVLSTPEIQPRLSEMELAHAAKFGEVLAGQFHASVLSDIPERYRGLGVDTVSYMPSIVTKPDIDVGVFVHARTGIPALRLPDGKTEDIERNSFALLRYRTVEAALYNEDIELV